MKRYPPPVLRAAVIAGLLVFVVAMGAFAQATQTGNIYGTVETRDGTPLPGVSVTLTGVGAPQTFFTDAQGRFRFLNLSPGTYSIRAELAGMGTATRSGVSVSLGRNVDVGIQLNPAMEQAITVTAEAPLLDVRKTGTGATVTKVELESVPTGRDPWVILQQTPGVLIDRVNVGGNESGQQSLYVAKGTGGEQSTWNVDGVNITDVGALGSSPTYYDFDSFEEMQLTTGGSDPRVRTAGVQLNMVTKRGTNELNGSARFFNTRNAWQAEPKIPSEAQSYLKAANEIDNIDDYGLEGGGPIIRDRLWLWGAYSLQQIDLLQASGTIHLTDKTELETFNGKLNAQIAAPNSLSIAAMLGNKIKLGRGVGPTRPQETGSNQDSSYDGPTMWKIEDTHVFGSNFYLTGLYSAVQGGFQLISDNGQGCNTLECGLSGEPTMWDFSETGDGIPHRSYYNYWTERPQSTIRADANTFFNTAGLSHELKFGFGYRDADVQSIFAWPGDQLLFYFEPNGTPNAFGGVQFNRFQDFSYNVKQNDFYVGDTMLWGNLTVQAGLRFDSQTAELLAGVSPANATVPDLIPAISYGGGDEVQWETISPRIGLTYALGSERKTLLRAAANRYVDQLGGALVYLAHPLYYSYVYFYFADANANRRADPGEVVDLEAGPLVWYGMDPNNPTQFVRRWDPDLEAPTTNELIFGVEHELLNNFVIGANATFRRMNDFIVEWPEKTAGSGNFYTSADYELARTIDFTVPNGGPTATGIQIYDLKSGVAPPVYYVFRNRPDYSQEYAGLEVSATKRMANRWMLRANLTYQDWKQNAGPDSYWDPTHVREFNGCFNCDDSVVVQGSGSGSGSKGGVYINSKYAYNLTGAYQVPGIETIVGFNLNGRQGYPIPYATRQASSEGRKVVLIDDVDAHRLPNVTTLDIRVAQDIRMGPTSLTLGIDVFNALNADTVMQRNLDYRQTTSNQHRITEMLSPRVFRLGARFTF